MGSGSRSGGGAADTSGDFGALSAEDAVAGGSGQMRWRAHKAERTTSWKRTPPSSQTLQRRRGGTPGGRR